MANWIPKIEYGPGPTTIEFDFPARGRDPKEEEIVTKGKVDETATGVQQTSFLSNIGEKEFDFGHVRQTIIDQLKTFYLTHASRGKEFDFYPDKDEAEVWTVTLHKSSRKFKPTGKVWDGELQEFKYDLKMKIRRVL